MGGHLISSGITFIFIECHNSIIVVMISFIVQEYKEDREFIEKMLQQISQVPHEKELVFVVGEPGVDMMWVRELANFPVKVIGSIESCGQARNVGARNAAHYSEALIFLDCHTCFTPEAIDRWMNTLWSHPEAAVGPAIQVVQFPSCEPSGGFGHGVAFKFVKHPFEWVWLPSPKDETIFPVPTTCGCAFAMTPATFRDLDSYGGFLWTHRGLGWEEEYGIRLWRLGHPCLIDKDAVVGHYFKQGWPAESTRGYVDSRMEGIYLNVFNSDVWDHVIGLIEKEWPWEWKSKLRNAEKRYYGLRKKLEPLKDKIDETEFFIIKEGEYKFVNTPKVHGL